MNDQDGGTVTMCDSVGAWEREIVDKKQRDGQKL